MLFYYANVYSNIVEEMDEEHMNASKILRDIGAKIGVFTMNMTGPCPGIPTIDQLKKVAREFVGLSNRMCVQKGGDFERVCDWNLQAVDRIKELMNIDG